MSATLALRLVLSAVSLYGYIQFFGRKIRAELALGFVLCLWGSIVFWAGLASVAPVNIMYASYAVFAAGLVLALISLRDIKSALAHAVTPGTVFFAVLCLLLFITLNGSMFTYQDNFTHWAVVSRILINSHRFPLPGDNNVWFASYPPGSTSFIYYICTVTGCSAEWMQSFAQAVLMAGCGCGIFAFAHSLKGYLLSGACIIMLMCCNIPLTELLVDTLLPMVAVGGIALCIYYRDKLKIFYTIPYIIMLTAIKNSGIFFAAAILIYALAVIPKNTKNILRWTACAACCAGTLKVWQMHVKLYFADGMTGKHSMSIANFKQVLGGKTDEELKIIVSAFADEVFSLSNNVIFILLVSAVIFSVYRFCRSSALKPAVHDCIFALISYILYQLGNLGMYIFTMPAEEAVCLACYDRYHDSILIFICAVMTIAVLQLAENISALPEQRLISCLMYLMCAAAVYVALKPDLSFFTRRNLPQNSDRVALMQIMEDYDIPLGSKCVIILDDDYGLQMSYRHMARYTLDSEDVKVRYLSDLKQQENLLNTHRYVIAFHQSDEISEYMREKFGENAPRAVDLTEQQL